MEQILSKITSKELLDFFELPFDDFSAGKEWKDDIGFSTIKKHRDGYISLYKVGIYKEDKGLKRLLVSVSYGQETEGGVRLGTGRNGLSDPIDLDFDNEFFFDELNQKFFHFKKEISPKAILLYVDKIHEKPTRMVGGLFLRTRLWFWREGLPSIIKIFDVAMIWFLWLISGEKIKGDILARYFGQKFEKKKEGIDVIEFGKSETMDFFGYHAKRWSVVFYCSLHLVIYYIFYLIDKSCSLASRISSDNFLILCYVVISFAITESMIPNFLKFIIKQTPTVFTKIAFRRINV